MELTLAQLSQFSILEGCKFLYQIDDIRDDTCDSSKNFQSRTNDITPDN